MDKVSLRGYLYGNLRELYEETHKLQEKALNEGLTDSERLDLNIKNAKLETIKDVTEICKNRKKY